MGIERDGEIVLLRGGRLVGSRNWSRLFWRFKASRVEQRRAIQAALEAHDFDRAMQLRAAWEADAIAPGETEEEQITLAAGACIVPGVCFRHRQLNYRGIILGSEPWCRAPAHGLAQMCVAQLPKGEAQPFYHCLVDERDHEGGQ